MPVGYRSGAGLEMLCGSCGGVLWPDERGAVDGAATDLFAAFRNVRLHRTTPTAISRGCVDGDFEQLSGFFGAADLVAKLYEREILHDDS